MSIGHKKAFEIISLHWYCCLLVQCTLALRFFIIFHSFPLQVAAESGYNMVHFTPVQELGISNSAYSIRQQLHLSPVYTRPGSAKRYDLDDLEKLLQNLNNNMGVSYLLLHASATYGIRWLQPL